MKMKADTRTADLLAWEPPPVVKQFAPDVVRAASLRALVSKAVAAALKDSPLSRDEIAEAMGAFLGEPVKKSSLDGYASETRDDHAISVVRLMALVHATGDVRLLQMLAEPFGHVVVDAKHKEAIEEVIDLDRKDQIEEYLGSLTQRIEARRRRRRGGAR